jgi:ribose transport system ATP-binding protein
MAKWLQLEPGLLLLDQPTEGVDVGAKATLYALIDQALERGAAVILASADLVELSGVCDRVLVMVDGLAQTSLAPPEVNEAELLRAMHA